MPIEQLKNSMPVKQTFMASRPPLGEIPAGDFLQNRQLVLVIESRTRTQCRIEHVASLSFDRGRHAGDRVANSLLQNPPPLPARARRTNTPCWLQMSGCPVGIQGTIRCKPPGSKLPGGCGSSHSAHEILEDCSHRKKTLFLLGWFIDTGMLDYGFEQSRCSGLSCAYDEKIRPALRTLAEFGFHKFLFRFVWHFSGVSRPLPVARIFPCGHRYLKSIRRKFPSRNSRDGFGAKAGGLFRRPSVRLSSVW